MIYKTLNFTWEYIIPIITPYFIYYMSSNHQIKIDAIPSEYIFDYNVALYSSLVVIACKILNYFIKTEKEKFSSISVIASKDNKSFINHDIDLSFKSDFAKLFFQIKLKGAPDRLKKKQISIFFPPQVYVQMTKNSKKYCWYDESSNCIRIEVSKLFNSNKTQVILSDSATFDLEIQKIDEFVESNIEVSIVKGNNMTSLESNKVSFKK